MSRLAEDHGLFGVLVGASNPVTAITAAVYASTATDFVRVVTRVQLGLEHPVTVAEELAVLDNVNNGRTVVVVDGGLLEPEDAADEILIIRDGLGNRPLHHDGPRWRVPAGLPANATAPDFIAVTPKPAQVEIPFWLSGPHALELGRRLSLPVLSGEWSGPPSTASVQPAAARITGDLAADRELVSAWAANGATHLLVELPPGDHAFFATHVSRYLVPEVAMPHFPRVMSQSRVPLPWPGDGRGR